MPLIKLGYTDEIVEQKKRIFRRFLLILRHTSRQLDEPFWRPRPNRELSTKFPFAVVAANLVANLKFAFARSHLTLWLVRRRLTNLVRLLTP